MLLSQEYFYVCHNGSGFFTRGTTQKQSRPYAESMGICFSVIMSLDLMLFFHINAIPSTFTWH